MSTRASRGAGVCVLAVSALGALAGCEHPTAVPAVGSGTALAPAARARLVATDSGLLVYDAALNAYWLADANLAATRSFGVTGIDSDGSMSWNTAMNWVAAMNDSNYLGHNDWRLPLTAQPDTGCTQQTSQGSFAYDCTASDMGELFYTELGGTKGVSIATLNTGRGRLFRHFVGYLYWSATIDTNVGKSSWDFSFGNGFEGTNLNANAMYALPLFPATPAAPPLTPPNVGLGVVPAVNAAPDLVRSGGGYTVYDKALNVTWLADADLAASDACGVAGINPDGSMSWHTAVAFIDSLNARAYLGHSTWRLPRTPDTDSTCSVQTAQLHQGSGYDCTGSEMGELFYTELGSEAGSTLARTHDRFARLFTGFQQSLYWSDSTAQGTNFGAWTFSFGNGWQGSNFFSNDLFVIPVLDGPIGTVDTRFNCQPLPQPPPRGCGGLNRCV